MPLLSCARPASNCGLISAISCAGFAAKASAGGSTSLSEMKLTSQTTRSGGGSRSGRGKGADIGLLQRHDFRPRAQAVVQLPAADIDRVDLGRAAFEQHLREAAGRGADIEADAAFRIEAEMVERRRQFHAAARDIRMRRARFDLGVGCDFLRRLGDELAVGAHQAGLDRGLRLGAAVEQSALDQQSIDAFFVGGHGAGLKPASPSRRRGPCRALRTPW